MTQFHSKGSLGDLLQARNAQFKELNEKCKAEKRPEGMKYLGLNSFELRLYMIDMCKAIHYCHNVIKVLHRDIKPDNIVLNHNNEAILIDFGVSAISSEISNLASMGTMLFFSPEMIKGSP